MTRSRLLRQGFASMGIAALLLGSARAQSAGGASASTFAIRGATIHPVTSPRIERGTIIVRDGLIDSIGPDSTTTIPPGMTVVDGAGRVVMPGIIDAHSHMGVYSWPGTSANSDGNELTSPVTAQIRAEDSVNLEDPAYARARAGGVTTVLVIPGSGNIIGGEGVVLKLRPGRLLSGMKMKEAPRQIKMAMGENPKRVYGDRGQLPSTRMGIVAKLREVFTKAQEYRAKKERHAAARAAWEAKAARWKADRDKAAAEGKPFETSAPDEPDTPDYDALSETLVDVMEGRVRVQVHCYRKDDVMDILRISDEYGFRIAALHHILEGYKVAPELAKRGIGAATWPDWWGFKMEAWDATPYNATIMTNAGVVVAFKSDSSDVVQRMYTEAAKGVKYGLTEDQALAAITINPARLLGIDKWVGSIEKGKHADLAMFERSPLDVYTRVEKTWIDGALVYDRAADAAKATFTEAGR